jgi:hypothetical protein
MRKLSVTSILSGVFLLFLLFGGCAIAEETSLGIAGIFPHSFYGTVEVAGEPAQDGVRVEARGEGVIIGGPHNPVFTQGGMYGKPGGLDPNKLLVQGSIASGTPIEFYVGDVKAEVFDVAAGQGWQDSYNFIPGEVTVLNLKISTEVTPEITVTTTATTSSVSYNQVTTSATSASAGSSVPGVSEPGSALLTVTPGQKTNSAGASSSPAQTSSPGAQPDSEGGSAGQESGPEENSSPTPAVTGQSSLPSWMLPAVFVVIVIVGGAAYYATRKKESNDEDITKKEEDE